MNMWDIGSSPKNLVYKSDNYQGQWICLICKDKDYDSGNWKCTSEEAIKYMMDPRNSINETDIFQFEELTNSGYNDNTLNLMVKGTYLDGHQSAIVKTAIDNNINPYYIVARLLQEQGKEGTVLTNGNGYNGQYIGYYNAFNVAASGNTKEQIILNALARAKMKGWTSLDSSIIGGISFIANKYIKNGQNTLYFQKFDVVGDSPENLYKNQYMQNIMAAENEGLKLKNTYSNTKSFDSPHTFIIPVYENMPKEVSPRPLLTENSTITSDLVKVNVIDTLGVRTTPNGSLASFRLKANEIVTRIEKANVKIAGTYWDKIQRADWGTGYVARETFDYEANYKLYLVPLKEETDNITIKGDLDGNNKIDAMDLYLIIQYILNNQNFNESQISASDLNDDGKVDAMDIYLLIQKIKSK